MTTTAPTTFTARRPEDLLAVVPAVLGFHPEESLVMLTFGGRRSFHARVDLPDDPEHLDPTVMTLLEPALRHRPRTVAFIAYSTDAVRAAASALLASDVFVAHDFGVAAPLRSDGRSWFRVSADEHPEDAEPHPYDVRAHAFTAQRVLDGRVTLASRAALVDSLAADPAVITRVNGHLERALAAALDGGDPPGVAALIRVVDRCVAAGECPSAEEVADLALGCRDVLVRDALFDTVTAETAEAHVDFWRSVVRRTPDLFVAAPAAVLAFCAWLSGHGALAWCAVDRALASDSDHPLATLVGELLEAAVPPSAWSVVRPRSAPEA